MPDRYSEIFISFIKDWSKRFISEFSILPSDSLSKTAIVFPIAVLDIMLNGINNGVATLAPGGIMNETHRLFEQSGTRSQYDAFGRYRDGMVSIIHEQHDNREKYFSGRDAPAPAGDFMTEDEAFFILTLSFAALSAVSYFGQQELPFSFGSDDDASGLYDFLCRALYDFRYETSKERNRLAGEIADRMRSGSYPPSSGAARPAQPSQPAQPPARKGAGSWLVTLAVAGGLLWLFHQLGWF